MTLRPCALAAVLRSLAEQLGLEGEDVVQDAIDAPALEAVVRDDAGALELPPECDSKRPVDTRAAANLGLLEQLEAAVERELAHPVLRLCHVPSSSTLPAVVTRALTVLSAGSGYALLVGAPSGLNVTG